MQRRNIEAGIAAAGAGDIAAFARLPKYAQRSEDAMIAAANHGQYGLLEWCRRNVMPRWNWKWRYMGRAVIANGQRGEHRAPAEWLIRKFPRQRQEIMSLVARYAVYYGDLEALEWAHEMGGVIGENLFASALGTNNLGMLDWFWRNGLCPQTMDLNMVSNDELRAITVPVCNWLSDRNLLLGCNHSDLLCLAVCWGAMAVLDWLESVGMATPENIAARGKMLLYAAKPKPAVAEWLKKRLQRPSEMGEG